MAHCVRCKNQSNSIDQIKQDMIDRIKASNQIFLLPLLCYSYYMNYKNCKGALPEALHHIPIQGKHVGMLCFFDYHNDYFNGLPCDNARISDTEKLDWVYPTKAKKKENA